MCRENQNAPFVFNKAVPKIVAFMRKQEEYGRIKQVTEGNIIRRMRYACNITKPADTHSVYAATRLNVAFIHTSLVLMGSDYCYCTVHEGAKRYSCFGIKISSLWL